MRVAIVGAGIGGLSAGWLLSKSGIDVTVFEAEDRLGGHAHTRRIDYDGTPISVDTGFIVLNDRNYPNIEKFFDLLDVVTAPSSMGFAVSVDKGRMEYGGGGLDQVFAQRSNLLSPRFIGMTLDILRFFREGKALLDDGREASYQPTLGEWLDENRYSNTFRLDHLLPMAAAIWSCPVDTMNEFPARSFLRFFLNHGLLDLKDRPQWRTVVGGSHHYVNRLAETFGDKVRVNAKVVSLERSESGVDVVTADGERMRFDHVVTGVHGGDLLKLVAQPDAEERDILGAFKTQPNEMYLHRDADLMPKRRKVWSSWNYISETGVDGGRAVSLTYWMNSLQPLPKECPLFVSLNPLTPPRDDLVFKTSTYHHPIFDTAAIAAQKRLKDIQGRGRIWYCGAWTGYGFHEDGLVSGIGVAKALGATVPWMTEVPAVTDRWLDDSAAIGAAAD